MTARRALQASALLALVAGLLSLYVGLEGAPLTGDVALARRVQDASALRANADWVNALGGWRWLPFVLAVVATGFGRWPGARAPSPAVNRPEALWGFFAGLLLWEGNTLLKLAVRSPRPVAGLGLDVDRLRDSYGFPSGHVYGDALVYGLLAVYAPAYLHPRLVFPVRAVLVAVIVLAGPARVVVGAHWPSDVLGGYLWGGAALLFAVAVGRRFR
ncbi:MAG: phosphatase PAP2 family protein [Dehalococcoidia bacterium]|nr:phosphatase PAP2 family protein [Dehalococcoidia bacterium]